MQKYCKAIITGPEHSGTTIIHNIINSHSKINSGFECGILLEDLKKFHNVKPFSDWLSWGGWMFGLPNNYKDEIKEMNYQQVFNYISKNKGKKNEEHEQKLIRSTPFYVDKTPRYIYDFENIYKKLPYKMPVFIIFKHYKNLFYSKVMKRKTPIKIFLIEIRKMINSLIYIKNYKFTNVFIFDENFLENIDSYSKFIMHRLIDQDISYEKISMELFKKKDKNNKMLYSNYNKNNKNNNQQNIDNSLVQKLNINDIYMCRFYDSLINELKVK